MSKYLTERVQRENAEMAKAIRTLRRQPDLYDQFVDFQKDWNQMAQVGIQERYALGLRLVQISRESRYGDQAIHLFAAGMNVDRSGLFRIIDTTKAYTQERIDHLASLQMRSGGRLTWTHLSHLARVEGTAEQDLLVQEVLQHSISAAALWETLVKRARPVETQDPNSLPQGVTDNLRQLRRDSRRFVRRLEGELQESVFAHLETEEEDGTVFLVTPEVKTQFQETKEDMRAAIVALQEKERMLSRIVRRMEVVPAPDLPGEKKQRRRRREPVGAE